MEDFKVGDMIHKIVKNEIIFIKRYIILSIREKKGGNWHDGYTTEYIATINEINKINEINEINEMKEVFELNNEKEEHNLIEVEEEEYLLRYTNYMCQCDVIFAHLIII
jgi:hypothetical protein